MLKAHTLDHRVANSNHPVVDVLASYGVHAKVVDVREGPRLERIIFEPQRGTRARTVVSLASDLARCLGVTSARIEAIPGSTHMAVETPRSDPETILLSTLLQSDEFQNSTSALPFVLGQDVEGKPLVADLAAMPHMLVAGTTGSGKSMGLHSLIISLAVKLSPNELRFVLIDPKRLEFEPYRTSRHLAMPVIEEVQDAVIALQRCVEEMERRYTVLAREGVRDIQAFNEKLVSLASRAGAKPNLMPRLVIVADELADLMIQDKKAIEPLLIRIAQKGRAAGLHLVLATQRPSVDVMTGVLKANIPARISFRLNTAIDSRCILDGQGAEMLLGAGDMLVKTTGSAPRRVHGAFVSDADIAAHKGD